MHTCSRFDHEQAVRTFTLHIIKSSLQIFVSAIAHLIFVSYAAFDICTHVFQVDISLYTPMAVSINISSFISFNLSRTALIQVILQSGPPRLRRRPLTATPLASSSASTTTAATITTDTTTTSITTTITRESPAWEESKTTWDGIECNCESLNYLKSEKLSLFRHFFNIFSIYLMS